MEEEEPRNSQAIRNLNKGKNHLEATEKKFIVNVKKKIETNNKDYIWNMVKLLAISRNFSKRITIVKAILKSISLETASLIRGNLNSPTMRYSGFALRKIKKRVKIAEKHIMAVDFKKLIAAMEMKEEINSDTINNILRNIEDDGEIESVVDKILNDLGINLDNNFSNLLKKSLIESL
ncbi:Charged multivesicular body protein 2a [Strongyloides ratti]|uniref:Charged multivesicular body protein 2a n=1 Tax=Strongyloides ratti TaxID=34506 RepID=A0A090L588_STRRB|nr:Charged multivesicular body protein 2a [Strongyloides ratti]CEF64971.1 Charged multivesicular body protein 2a [Strongyloides ratti]